MWTSSIMRVVGATLIGLCSLISNACTPASDDMMALGSSSENAASTLNTVGSEAAVIQQIGRDRAWTLVLIPAAATAADLRKAGINEELVEKLSARSATWHGQDCLAYFDPGRLAYSEWPQRAGDIRVALVITGSARHSVRLRLVREMNGVVVVDAGTVEP